MPLDDDGWTQEDGLDEIANNIRDVDDPEMILKKTKQLIKSWPLVKVQFW